jgi:hypothetical protein
MDIKRTRRCDRETQRAIISQRVIVIAIAAQDVATLTRVALRRWISTRLREPAADDINQPFVGLSRENVQWASDGSAAERGIDSIVAVTKRTRLFAGTLRTHGMHRPHR